MLALNGIRVAWVSLMPRLRPSSHETIKKRGQRFIAIQWKNDRNVLIWPHDHHAAALTIDAAHVEYVVACLRIGAEYFFVIAERETAFPGEEKGRHALDGEALVPLLEDRSEIDHGIDVRACRGISPDRRPFGIGKKSAQPSDG